MVRTFLKVYMELGSYFLFLQDQKKDIIISSIPIRPPNALPPAPSTSEGEWILYKILPLAQTPLLHAPDHITILCYTREALPSNTTLLTFKSPEHGDSIVHMYPLQRALKNPDVGAVLDTGAQRSAAKYPAEILEHTHTSHAMKGAFGRPTTIKGILMGCSTVDIQSWASSHGCSPACFTLLAWHL